MTEFAARPPQVLQFGHLGLSANATGLLMLGCDVPGNLLAFVGAMFAGIGAPLAMFVMVFPAFLGAGAADLRAKPAETDGELGPARHEFRRHRANHGAIIIQPDAALHFMNAWLGQACARAMATLGGTVIAGIDAVLELLVHSSFSFETVGLGGASGNGEIS